MGCPRTRRAPLLPLRALRPLALLATLLPAWISDASDSLADDEVVVLYPTLGAQSADGSWQLPVHGRVYEPEEGDLARGLLLRALELHDDLDRDAEGCPLLRDRLRGFLADNERGLRLTVQLGGQAVAMEKSGHDGHFVGAGVVDTATAQRLGRATPAGLWLPVAISLPEGDRRQFATEALLLPPTGLSVVSDLDDTVKISEVRNRKALLRNTFCRPFAPVPGLAARYAASAARGASFHYVSASPWQLYEPLAAFLAEQGFPAGALSLKPFRLKDRSFFNLFDAPEEYKIAAITPLLQRYPGRSFLLVGDSGERDPEAYATLARRFPKQIKGILIRDVTNEPRLAPRYQQLFAGLPEGLWRLFTEATELGEQLPE